MRRAAVLVLASWPALAFAQADPDVRQLLEQHRRQIEQIQRDYEARIQALEAEMLTMKESREQAAQQDELDALLREAEGSSPPPIDRPNVQANALNPAISVIPDFAVRLESHDRKAAQVFGELFQEKNPFSLRETELDLRAAVSPAADAVAILAIGDEGTAFEEAYITLHSLPYDLQAKIGRFKLNFGRANTVHNHDLPQIDRPAVHRLVFGDEGTSVDGVSVSKPLYTNDPGDLLPTYSDITVELSNAANDESPLFGRGAKQEVAGDVRWKNFWQITPNSDLEAGVSALFTGENRFGDQSSQALGADLTLRINDPDPSTSRNWLIQTEVIGTKVGRQDDSVTALGSYLTVQRQLTPNTYTGLRLDAAESPLRRDAGIWGAVPYYTWYVNEFLRLRVQYQYMHGTNGNDSAVAQGLGIQLTWVFGAHPPEPYWVNR